MTPLIALAFLFSACAEGGAEAEHAPATSHEQVVHVEASGDGYHPETVTLVAEKPVRLIVTRTAESVCIDTISIPAFDVQQKELPLDEPVEISFTPEKTGDFTFTCGMDMQEGTLVIEA